MTTDIELLKPVARDAIKLSILDFHREKVPYVITSTLRRDVEQIALYAQGRKSLIFVNSLRKKAGMYLIDESENSYTVTNCDGIIKQSNHQSGLAIDIVPADEKGNPVWPNYSDERWQQISEIMIRNGFTWGKSFDDYPHYEIKE